MTMPKKIFYVWGANEEKRPDVLFCINSWKQNLPEYEIIEINESSIEYFNFQKELENNLWFKTVYNRKMYAYVADYIRIKTLYDNGGIYLDTDVSVLKNFDEFLNEPAFVGIQDNSEDGQDDFTEPAILGSNKHNPFLFEVLDFYKINNKHNIWNTNIYTLPQIFKLVLEKLYGEQKYPKKENQVIIYNKEITLYPEEYFIPYRWGNSFNIKNISKNTSTIHWFGGSWTKPNVLYFLNHKHLIPLDEIDKIPLDISEIHQPNSFIENIFSVKNEYLNKIKRKILTIFGVKIKFKVKNKAQTLVGVERERERVISLVAYRSNILKKSA